MALTYVGSSGTSGGGTGLTNSVVMTKPVGLATGDLMIAFCTLNLNTVTPPSGWTQYASDDASSGALFRNIVFWKIATSGDAAATNFTFTTGTADSPFHGGMLAYRGADPNIPISNATLLQSTTAQNQAGTNITTTARNIVVHFRSCRRASATQLTFTATGPTERFDTGNNGASTSYSSAAYDTGTVVTAGTVTAVTINASAAPTDGFSRLLAIREAIDGSADATLPSLTSDLAGTMTTPSGVIGSQLASVTSDFTGMGAPPEGSISASLAPVVTDLAGTSIGGSFTATLPSITSDWVGGQSHGSISSQLASVVSDFTGGIIHGSFDSQLGAITADFVAESRKFGEHVIVVEADDRAFRVTDDGTGLVPIKRSQVTLL